MGQRIADIYKFLSFMNARMIIFELMKIFPGFVSEAENINSIKLALLFKQHT